MIYRNSDSNWNCSRHYEYGFAIIYLSSCGESCRNENRRLYYSTTTWRISMGFERLSVPVHDGIHDVKLPLLVLKWILTYVQVMVYHLGVYLEPFSWTHIFCRPRLLRRLVEQRLVGSVCTGLESAGAQLSSPTRLPFVNLNIES